jgi:hypothetical protein
MGKEGKYNQIIAGIFHRHYREGLESFNFRREELSEIAAQMGIDPAKNLGDILYSFRYRKPLPKKITNTAPPGKEWIIESNDRSNYTFRLTNMNRIIPNVNLMQIKIPDATPEIIDKYNSGDEQSLLTKIRYNRLIDIFLGITSYSLQNHLRSTVTGIGQIEIDEIYVGINHSGTHFIVPVQAKAGSDQMSVVQTKQDIGYCSEKYPQLKCRAVSAQFMNKNIAMFELAIAEGEVKIIQEKHYKLVSSDQISSEDLENYQHGT